jgi:hypothetical protein
MKLIRTLLAGEGVCSGGGEGDRGCSGELEGEGNSSGVDEGTGEGDSCAVAVARNARQKIRATMWKR